MQPIDEKPSGFLVLDKPSGISSARALDAVKRHLPRGTKVGHAGTLDPFATGVLVVLVGAATKQCERVMGFSKGYEATMRPGATSPTLDLDSQPVELPGVTPPTTEQLLAALSQFEGEIEQIPPAISAIKVSGRRACDIVRAGEAVQLRSRRVRVNRLELIRYQWPEVQVVVECGRGFYVRSLARDMGESLGVGGYLTSLRRTFVGPFGVELAAGVEGAPLELMPVSWIDRRL